MNAYTNDSIPHSVYCILLSSISPCPPHSLFPLSPTKTTIRGTIPFIYDRSAAYIKFQVDDLFISYLYIVERDACPDIHSLQPSCRSRLTAFLQPSDKHLAALLQRLTVLSCGRCLFFTCLCRVSALVLVELGDDESCNQYNERDDCQ
jgi:hypothetical protein